MVQFNENIFGNKDDKPKNSLLTQNYYPLDNVYLNNQRNYQMSQEAMNTPASSGMGTYSDYVATKKEPVENNLFDKIKNVFSPKSSNKNDQYSVQAIADIYESLPEEDKKYFIANPKKYIEQKISHITSPASATTLSDSDKMMKAWELYKDITDPNSENYDEDGHLANALNDKWKFEKEEEKDGLPETMITKLAMFDAFKKARDEFLLTGNNDKKLEAQMWADQLYDKGWVVSVDADGGISMEEKTNVDMGDTEPYGGVNNWYLEDAQNSKTWSAINEQKDTNQKQMRELMGVMDTYDPMFLTIFGKWKTSMLKWEEFLSVRGESLTQEERDYLKREAKFSANAFNIFNSYVKFITGAQMSEKEVDRLKRAYPMLSFDKGIINYFRPDGDTPTTYQAKADLLMEVTRDSFARFNLLTNDNIFQTLVQSGAVPQDEVEKATKNLQKDQEKAFYQDDMGNIKFNTARYYVMDWMTVKRYKDNYEKILIEQKFEAIKKSKQNALGLPDNVSSSAVELNSDEKAKAIFEAIQETYDLFEMNYDGQMPLTFDEHQQFQAMGLIN